MGHHRFETYSSAADHHFRKSLVAALESFKCYQSSPTAAQIIDNHSKLPLLNPQWRTQKTAFVSLSADYDLLFPLSCVPA